MSNGFLNVELRTASIISRFFAEFPYILCFFKDENAPLATTKSSSSPKISCYFIGLDTKIKKMKNIGKCM